MAKRPVQDYPSIALKPDALDGVIDFTVLFGRPAPIEIEIGSGKGTFLLEQARACPDTDFIGIEWASKYCRFAVDRMGRWGLANVRLIRTDAVQFITAHIGEGVVDGFHLYFPDPWPKTYHHRRRFFQEGTLARMLLCLKPDGWINMATDHENYFAHMRRVADKAIQAGQVVEIPFRRPAGARDDEIVGTNYERKYKPEGRPTYTLALQKLTPNGNFNRGH